MDKLCYKLIKIILTCDKKLFVYIMFDIAMHHACMFFPHQGDLIMRDDISLRHLTFNNIKCNVYTRTLKPPGLKISQNDSSFLNFLLIFKGLNKVHLKIKYQFFKFITNLIF